MFIDACTSYRTKSKGFEWQKKVSGRKVCEASSVVPFALYIFQPYFHSIPDLRLPL